MTSQRQGSIGKAIPHDSATGHVTGTAKYIEDLPRLSGELWVDFAGTPVPAGRIVSIQTDAAEAMDEVIRVFTYHDLGGVNQFGPIFHDEPFLAEEEIGYLGQPVAVVAATTRTAARRAAQAIKVEVVEATPILNIESAIEAGSYLGPMRKIQRGDVNRGFEQSVHLIEGTFRNNGQEQFYFESQACQAIPDEEGTLKLNSSTQHPTEIQAFVAEVLGLSMHQVVCECKRMGGAFGGKESQSAIPALMVALAAHKTGRPARIVYSKHQDMLVTGKRHPYVSRYKVGFDARGRIVAAKFDFFSNGGAYADLSTAVMERTMMHADNCYCLPNASITGQVCKTNLPPNTAFRGFGGPQGVVVIENAIQEFAATTGIDALQIRKENLYRDGDPLKNLTPYGQIVEHHVIPELFEQLETDSGYQNRLERVQSFNQDSPTQLKGIAMSGIKFGISFTSKFLNQGNALVNIYTDGTIQVSTGGTEMGQGLNTKIRQLVADEFGVPFPSVRVMASSTEKSNNTSPTAASAGTDLNGAAAVLACERIRARMAKYATELFALQAAQTDDAHVQARPEDIGFDNGLVFDRRDPTGRLSIPFGEFCTLARRERVDLGERAFYATPGVDFNRETGQGTPFFYYTTGAAVAEVTVDRFTGDLTVDRVDLLMDIGQMINPGIDKGQVIGGFVQGMGWCTGEELVYDDHGLLLSTGPTTYKIPNVTDIPQQFNVDFLPNPKHQKNVRLSKAVGEPPLMLGIAPWLAVKHALSFVAEDKIAELKLPATNEEVLMCMTGMQTSKSATATVQA